MKKIIRISQKDLNKLLMREIEQSETMDQPKSADIFNGTIDDESNYKTIKLKDIEIDFLLEIMDRIDHDDETEEQCISNIKNALNNSKI